MYREFFGLTLKPFSITPDPRFLYMSPGHKEALAHLLYGLKEASGFVVITGEVGTGKTTILNAFLLKLPPRMPKVVVKNPHIRPENLYFLLGEAIGLPEEKRTRDHIASFEGRLKEMGGAVLIVDESQGLSEDMLEEVRLLSNMETVHEKLVQIMLLGQQELNEKLKNPSLRQLKQRIGIKYHIPPLDSNETKDYIDHRLRVAGYEPKEKPLFTVSALTEIFRYTKGYPRLINIVCDNVLIAAYTDNIKQISAPLVRRTVSELEDTYKTRKGVKSGSGLQLSTGIDMQLWLKRAGIGIFLVLSVIATAWFFTTSSNESTPLPLSAAQQGPAASVISGTPVTNAADISQRPEETVAPDISLSTKEGNVGVNDVPEEDPTLKPPILPSPPPAQAKNLHGTVVTVKAGDTVAKLAAEYYGWIDIGILQAVKNANPEIPNIDLIHRGQKISLPQLSIAPHVLFSVSIESYNSMDDAKTSFTGLIGKGYQATIYPYLDNQEKTMYRVTIGTFTSRQEAIEYARQLQAKGFPYAKPVKISMEE